MKRELQKLFALVALFSLPFLLWSQGVPDDPRRLVEGFEDGIPSEWTQENVKGAINWVVNSGELTYPKGAYEGKSRVEFKGNSNVTTKARSRLITPPIDVISNSYYQPILIFAHAQSTWTEDFDTLKVLYRASADKEWTVLKVYDQPIKSWRVDTLGLIGASATYQIAFEASDNLGRGVVIDDVVVRSTPRCVDPYGLQVTGITNTTATISWVPSYDAKSINLKVSTTQLTAEQLASDTLKADVLDVTLDKSAYEYKLEDLATGAKYYHYIRYSCGVDMSNWVGGDFKTSNVIEPSYKLDFNNRSNGVTYPLNCFVGSSENVTPPYVNVGATAAIKQALSPDATTVLCFNGAVDNKAITAMPASSYSYFALPQMVLGEGKRMSDLYVTFSAINYDPCYAQKSAVIVGVMTDPSDYGTFVVVDTVNITSMRQHEQVYVSLEKYTGEGAFIAFVSEFDVSNIFIMDNLKVDYRPEVLKVNNFQMQLLSATQVKLDFPFNYDKYEVVLSETQLMADSLARVIGQEIVDGATLEVKPSTQYYVYARGIKGTNKGEWSDRRILHTVGKNDTLPVDLNININRLDQSSYYQVCYENSQVQSGGLMMHNMIVLGNSSNMFAATDAYKTTTRPWVYEAQVGIGETAVKCWTALVLPEFTFDFKTTRMNFELMTPDGNEGSVVVGSMTDARDISTFQPLATFVANKGFFKYHYIDFANYDVKGKFIAILVSSENVERGLNNVRIDNVKFTVMPTCGNVTNLLAQSPGDPSKVVISWDKTDADAWVVALADFSIDYERIDEYGESVWDFFDTVTTNRVEIPDLQGPGHKYYYVVRAVCNGVSGEWSHPEFFETGCWDVQPIPYNENFDNTDYMFFGEDGRFAVPCMATQDVAYSGFSGSETYYPLLGRPQGAQSTGIIMMKNEAQTKNLYLALPKMAEPLNKLQLSFDAMMQSGTSASFSVGVMTNPYDSTTIERLDTFVINTCTPEYLRYIATFEDYKGTGEYIVITLNSNCVIRNGDMLFFDIDNINVDFVDLCSRPEDVTIDSYDADRVTLSWNTRPTVSKWRILHATKRFTYNELAQLEDNANVFKIDTVTSNKQVVITGLNTNTEYHVYVQPLCDTTVGAWSNPVKFRTPCQVVPISEMAKESFENYTEVTINNTKRRYPECYIVGTLYEGEVGENYDLNNYVPNCYTTASYVHSGASCLLIQTVLPYNGAYAITNKLDVDDWSKVIMRFWGSAKGRTSATYAKSLIIGVVTDPTDLVTFTPLDTLTFGDSYRQYEVTFDKYKHDIYGDTGTYVMFYSNFDKNNGVYIDDVEFDTVPPCKTKLEIDSVGIESIRVKVLGGIAPYQVKYSTTPVTSEDVLNGTTLDSITSLDSEFITITGLSKSTTYYVYARSMCDGSYTAWTLGDDITTECPAKITLPFLDNFDDQPIHLKKTMTPLCWNTLYTNNASAYPTIYASGTKYYPTSGKVGVYFSVKPTNVPYLVTPEIDVESLSRCKVSFSVVNEAKNKKRVVIVGAVSDVSDIEGTFEPVDTIEIAEANTFAYHKGLTVSFENYKGTAKHIGFTTSHALSQKYSSSRWQNESSSTAAIFTLDDVQIELIPTCFPGTDFKMVAHSDNSIELEFTHEGAPQYEVKYGSVGFDVATEGNSMIIDTTRFVVTGLEAATEYDVYVRTICAEDDKSVWGKAGKFFTAPKLISEMPYNCNFDTDESEAAKWVFAQFKQTNQWWIGVDDAKVVSDKGGKALYISNDSAKSAHYNPDVASYSWAYRALPLEAGVYTISFDWTCYGDTANDYVRAGLLPTTSTFVGGSGSVKNIDGTSGVLGNALSEGNIKGWIELADTKDNAYRLNCVDTALAMAEQWKKVEKTIVVTPEMAGLYNMVFYWANNASVGEYASKRSAVIDNIHIERAECTCPYDFKLNSVLTNEATITILSASATKSFEVVAFVDTLDAASVTEDKLAFHKTVEGEVATINGLTPGTDYKVYVRTVCSAGNNSIWAGPFEFTTACSPIAVNTLFSFDNEGEHYNSNANKPLPNCFVNGHDDANASSSYLPYLIKNNASTQYSRSGDYALLLSRKEGNQGGYIAMPLVDGDLDTLQLTFWMRCVTNTISTGAVATGNLANDMGRKVTVGTMTNPLDPTTFEAIGTYEYSYTTADLNGKNITNDPDSNSYWMEITVPLEGVKGQYITFKNEYYGKEKNYVYIDDVVVLPVSCYTPNNLSVSSITSHSAVVDFNHSVALKYLIQTSTKTDFVGAKVDTVTALPYSMEGLDAGKTYYVKVQSICAVGDTSNWSPSFMFETNKTTPYTEAFDKIVNNMAGWQVSKSCSAEEVFAGTEIVYSSELTADTWTTDKLSTGLLSTIHMRTTVQNTSGLSNATLGSKTWLVSPIIDFTDATANYHLMFDLALTDVNADSAPSKEDMVDKDDRFMVIVSDDEGKTWKKENAIVWGATTDDYEYYNIPSTGKRYEFDLTKYAGTQIRVAFYAEANNSGATTEIHVDNVHINVSTTDIVESSVCQTEGFENQYFSYESNELVLGENSASYWEENTEKGKADVLRGVRLNLLPMVETTLTAQICEGDVYDLNNFPSLMESGRYKQKVRSANGCDSVVVLDLTVIPTQRTTYIDSICYGGSIMWNGVEYTEPGNYVDTLESSMGCDSIVTFVLIRIAPIETEDTVYICYGESYTLGDQVITTTGNFTANLTTADGCDSIVTIHAIALPDYRLSIEETIKRGEQYTGHGFVGLTESGVHTLELTSTIGGCDSTITLTLTVLDGDTTYMDVDITTDDLPYSYKTIYYDENTKPGVYVDTIVDTDKEGKEYVIIHTLTVKEGTALDVVNNFDLIMVPNPVNVNNTLYINADFSAEERDGMIVEVFNTMGQCVYMSTPSIYPIEINGLNTSGVYVVRVVTGNGKSYQGKIIVE